MLLVPVASPFTHTLSSFVPQAGGPVRALQVNVERSGSVLNLRYTLDADLARIRIPERRPPAATNELWKHTCFEAFLMPASGSGGYRELNFSPSTQWAAYSFTGYREGMAAVAMTGAPEVRAEVSASALQVEARVNIAELFPEAASSAAAQAAGAGMKTLRIALAAVIEHDTGELSYWALKHAPSRPDFHDPAGFILEV